MTRANTFQHIDGVLSAVKVFSEAVRSSEHDWHWKKLREYAQGLFDRAPFREGDRVRLRKTPTITEKDSWGWMHAKHFLVEGREGVAKDVDFRDGQFVCGFLPDDQTWIPEHGEKKGIPQAIESPGIYYFREEYIERVTPQATDQKEGK
jgi:hypothetical protein